MTNSRHHLVTGFGAPFGIAGEFYFTVTLF